MASSIGKNSNKGKEKSHGPRNPIEKRKTEQLEQKTQERSGNDQNEWVVTPTRWRCNYPAGNDEEEDYEDQDSRSVSLQRETNWPGGVTVEYTEKITTDNTSVGINLVKERYKPHGYMVEKKYNESGLKRMAREIKIIQKLEGCENIVRMLWILKHDKFKEGSIFFELCQQETLKSWISSMSRDEGIFWEVDVWNVAQSLVKALVACHTAGIFHRNLKPAHVFLHSERDKKLPKVILGGFGCAVQESIVKGHNALEATTKEFRPPEYDGKSLPTPQIDIYQLGTVLLSMCATENQAEKLPSRLEYEDLEEEFSATLLHLIAFCRARNPKRRPTSLQLDRQIPRLLERLQWTASDTSEYPQPEYPQAVYSQPTYSQPAHPQSAHTQNQQAAYYHYQHPQQEKTDFPHNDHPYQQELLAEQTLRRRETPSGKHARAGAAVGDNPSQRHKITPAASSRTASEKTGKQEGRLTGEPRKRTTGVEKDETSTPVKDKGKGKETSFPIREKLIRTGSIDKYGGMKRQRNAPSISTTIRSKTETGTIVTSALRIGAAEDFSEDKLAEYKKQKWWNPAIQEWTNCPDLFVVEKVLPTNGAQNDGLAIVHERKFPWDKLVEKRFTQRHIDGGGAGQEVRNIMLARGSLNIVHALHDCNPPHKDSRSIVLEYCDLGNLEQCIKRILEEIKRKPKTLVRWLDQKFIKELFLDVAKGVKYCHAHGIVHRDIKPANILLQSDPDKERTIFKLGDFGSAIKLEIGRTNYPELVPVAGHWWPPEFLGASGSVRTENDIWQMGMYLVHDSSSDCTLIFGFFFCQEQQSFVLVL